MNKKQKIAHAMSILDEVKETITDGTYVAIADGLAASMDITKDLYVLKYIYSKPTVFRSEDEDGEMDHVRLDNQRMSTFIFLTSEDERLLRLQIPLPCPYFWRTICRAHDETVSLPCLESHELAVNDNTVVVHESVTILSLALLHTI